MTANQGVGVGKREKKCLWSDQRVANFTDVCMHGENCYSSLCRCIFAITGLYQNLRKKKGSIVDIRTSNPPKLPQPCVQMSHIFIHPSKYSPIPSSALIRDVIRYVFFLIVLLTIKLDSPEMFDVFNLSVAAQLRLHCNPSRWIMSLFCGQSNEKHTNT